MVVKIRIAVSMFAIVIGLTNCVGSAPVPQIAVPMPRPYNGGDFAWRNRLLNGDVEQGGVALPKIFQSLSRLNSPA